MKFESILFKRYPEKSGNGFLRAEMPQFFTDLNLDQIVDKITYTRDEYDLKPFFYTPVDDPEIIRYRQEVMTDLENEAAFKMIKSFAAQMRSMRNNLPKEKKHYYKYQRERIFLDSVEIYCDNISTLLHNLFMADLKSPGLLDFRSYLKEYFNSARFSTLLRETQRLIASLDAVKYCVLTKQLTVRVLNYSSESDYSAEVGSIFEKFKQNTPKDYRMEFPPDDDLNQVEANILIGVSTLYADLFKHLEEYFTGNAEYLDETIARFDREIQFYISYLDYIAALKPMGLNFCYPEVARTTKEIDARDVFDLALAYKLKKEESTVVPNNFYLKNKERVIVVTGPNQGGKTTFARTFGQLHYLAKLGCPVPGSYARLYLYDRLFTHFEKEEDIKDHRSKLEDDLFRIHSILKQSTGDSIIIMNEILSSTTLQDAIFLSKKIMGNITTMDLLCVWVTFIDELTLFSDKNVSMISKVDTRDPASRTFKIVRSPADGLAYALSIAEKYKVTYNDLKKRIKS